MNLNLEIQRIVINFINRKNAEINGILYIYTKLGTDKKIIEKIKNGYFLNKESKEFLEYRELLNDKNNFDSNVWFTDLYEIYKIFHDNNLYTELDCDIYYIDKKEIRKWKQFVFKKIKDTKKIFILQDPKLEKQIEINKEIEYQEEIEIGKINIKLIKDVIDKSKNKKKLEMIFLKKIVTDIKSFLFFLSKEKIAEKKDIDKKYRRHENWL
jgi:hypothetical protein